MELVAILWLGLLIAFVVVEAACPIHLVSIWFAAGALVALIASLLSAPIWLQVTLFLLVSCIALSLLRPLLRKFITPKVVKTNVDAIVGTQGLVTAPIDNVAATGQVKLGAMEWSARSTSGEKIEAGTLVKVDRIEGVKAFVSPVEVKVNV
jgi:membrane protein implicated in regulation of membrane protease activity